MTQETPITSNRFTLVHKEDLLVDLEYNEDFVILHLPYVKKLSRDLYLDMIDSLEKFEKFLKTMGKQDLWAAIPPEEKLLHKLLGKLGFTMQGNSEGFDVYRKEL